MDSSAHEGDILDVLVVDDHPHVCGVLCDAVVELGHRAYAARDGAEALAAAAERVFDVVLCDVRMPRIDGVKVFQQLRREVPGTEVILMTGFADTSEAVEAIKSGAYDYLSKPFGLDDLRVRLLQIGQRRALRRALHGGTNRAAGSRGARGAAAKGGTGAAGAAAEPALGEAAADELLGTSPQIARVRQRIVSIAASDAPVLVLGDSGTGKELVARRIHDLGARRARPFVAINCAAFPETLLEAELFGHERGAFTGALKRREGRFKAAHGGTLFLDEIAEIPPAAQVKLLRVLEEGVVEPLGTDEPMPVDVRIVSATHRNLKERIAAGSFREDLYYRLNVLDVVLPPLRERRGDLPVLVGHFLRLLTPEGEQAPAVGARAWAAVANYGWPGNVRELKHAVEHAVVLARARAAREIGVEDLPDDVAARAAPALHSAPEEPLHPLAQALQHFEREYLARALALTDGRRSDAAKRLGISRKSLWKKLRAHGLSGPPRRKR
jgi:DNA-binding NtrC family response regulator